MKREQLAFELPKELIAQEPAEPRGSCKLMVLNKKDESIEHDRFFHLGKYLNKGDVLVFNESKVLPARLIGARSDIISHVTVEREVLLLKELRSGIWACMIRGKIKPGDKIEFQEGLIGEVAECDCAGAREGARLIAPLHAPIQDFEKCPFHVKFNKSGPDFLETIHKIGLMPTPPYMKQLVGDNEKYQTVYANQLGSAAAPTAGLHFTERLLDELEKHGIQQEFVTLHVGLGTFQPIKSEIVEEHNIHSEYYEVKPDVYQRLKQAKEEGRRIIAVGTTSVRVLETIFDSVISSDSREISLQAETKIFIYPGYEFKAVDALITNFHTPYSSLLALVYAFCDSVSLSSSTGEEIIKKAYQEAISQDYRFFSFGDAMFIE